VSLSVALNTARSALSTTAKQIAVSGSNVAGADDPGRTRKIAQTVSDGLGSVRLATVTRATDLPLFYRLLDARATGSGQNALVEGLNRLHDTVGDPSDKASPSAKIAAFATALQASANAPHDRNLAQAALTAARGVASSLAASTELVQSVRNEADTAIADSVTRLDRLLAELAEANTIAVRQSIAGEDATDALDRRDALLGAISDEVGITVVTREHNDIAVYTDSGVTLLDKTPRAITFATGNLAAGVDGAAIIIDGVAVTGAGAAMPIHSGKLAGLSALRDEIAPAYQAQLDEIARGLVQALAEADQSGNGGPDLAGLITWSGGPALPPAGTLVSGMAAALAVNAAVDPAAGGNLDRLRDGGINGPDYRYNPTLATGYSDRLGGMLAALTAAQTFDAAAGLPGGIGVTDFSVASVSWLEDQRQVATRTADTQAAMVARATDALSNSTGINIDDEYALQLRLEQSYQASSKLIAVVNSMMESLLQAVG
jgi:flagellar hook-associated protein 1 FlgK